MESSIDQVLLAILFPAVNGAASSTRFQRLGIPMLQVPSVDDLTSGRARIDALGRSRLRICQDAMRCLPSPSCLGQVFVMRWSASQVLVVRLVQSLPPDPGVVAGEVDPA